MCASDLTESSVLALSALDVEHVYRDGDRDVFRFVVGPIDNNVFVIRCRHTGDAVLLDAANEHERLLQVCNLLGVRRVLETHGHWDHIGAVVQVAEAGIDIAITPDDVHYLGDTAPDTLLSDNEVIQVGRTQITTIATPGHTPGSMCFAVNHTPLLFTGDTLFPGGPGATHFPGGDFPTIMTSLDQRLFSVYNGDTVVLPGHGNFTTLAQETPWFHALSR
jgi:glyoxylase-like metal-dependent hydrolase (beta-lactamase superfamily II)